MDVSPGASTFSSTTTTTVSGPTAIGVLPSVRKAKLDNYVTQKAMDGLYAMIAEKEKSFRANPVEAGSALLKKIFGAL